MANMVLNNTIVDSEDGLAFNGMRNTISGNYFSGIRRRSFVMWGVGENVFSGNTITNSRSELGFDSGGWNNVIYHNNFISNTLSSYDYGNGTQWDNGSQGNYWSRYTGVDGDGDGVGDSPYLVPPNGVDRYPLMLPCQQGPASRD
jgi:nitrous oxidase accessory protein